MNQKILLINPPNRKKKLGDRPSVLPGGPLSLAAGLLDNDFIKKFDIEIIDCVKILDLVAEDINFNLHQYLADNKFDIVGITCNTQAMEDVGKIAEEVKKHHNNTLVIVGGPHPSALPKETLQQNPNIDIVAIGAGEITLAEIIATRSQKENYSHIKGIAYRMGENIIVNDRKQPKRQSIAPMYHKAIGLLNLNKYGIDTGKWPNSFTPPAFLFTAKGCYGKCTMCASQSTFGYGISDIRTAAEIFETISYVYDHYDMKEFVIYDDIFIFNQQRILQLSDLVANSGLNGKLHFRAITHASNVNDEIAGTGSVWCKY